MVGREMLKVLAENGVPAELVGAFASGNSAGKKLPYGTDAHLIVRDTALTNFKGYHVALLAVEAEVSKTLSPMLAKQNVLVVDNSSQWRMHKDVPLVVPEINPDDLWMSLRRGIIANPNCATIQMLMVLKPLHDKWGLKEVIAVTEQSVSGAGDNGVRVLAQETKGLAHHETTFVAAIAGNVIPQIGPIQADGYTAEEEKIRLESRKILGLSKLKVSATCVRVPVVRKHSVVVHAVFRDFVDAFEANELLERVPGVRMAYTVEQSTPRNVSGDDVVVSRLRESTAGPKRHGLEFWCTADNVRKGAALNAVQIVGEWQRLKQSFDR